MTGKSQHMGEGRLATDIWVDGNKATVSSKHLVHTETLY